MVGAWVRPCNGEELDAEGVPTSFRRTMEDVAQMLGDDELLANSRSSIHDRRHSQRFAEIHAKFFGDPDPGKRHMLEVNLEAHQRRRQRHADDWRAFPPEPAHGYGYDAAPRYFEDGVARREFSRRHHAGARAPSADSGGGGDARPMSSDVAGFGDRFSAGGRRAAFPDWGPGGGAPAPQADFLGWHRQPPRTSEGGGGGGGGALYRSPPRPRTQEHAPGTRYRIDHAGDYDAGPSAWGPAPPAPTWGPSLTHRRPPGLPEQSDSDRLFLARARKRWSELGRLQIDPRTRLDRRA